MAELAGGEDRQGCLPEEGRVKNGECLLCAGRGDAWGRQGGGERRPAWTRAPVSTLPVARGWKLCQSVRAHCLQVSTRRCLIYSINLLNSRSLHLLKHFYH